MGRDQSDRGRMLARPCGLFVCVCVFSWGSADLCQYSSSKRGSSGSLDSGFSLACFSVKVNCAAHTQDTDTHPHYLWMRASLP